MHKKTGSHLKRLFWSLDDKGVDFEKDKNYVIHHTLALGTMDDVRTLFKLYGKETVRREFKKPMPGLYHPNVFNLFKHVLKVKHLDKNRYLKNIHAHASRNSR